MIYEPVPLVTDRLVLRHFRAADLEPTLAYYSDPEVARYLLEQPWSRAEGERQIGKRVTRRLDARNEASARMCERLGMVKEAHFRQDWWSKGEWTDTAVYGLLATEAPR